MYTSPSENDNSFLDPETANIWIKSVESESGQFRDKFIYPMLKTWLDNPAITRVLDIGAGQGVASTFVTDKEYAGIEPSETLVARAKEKYGDETNVVLGNVYEIPFPNKHFDGAFSINVWFHLEDVRKASAEMSRVLRDDSPFLVITANPDAYDIWESFYKNKIVDDIRIEGITDAPGVAPYRSVMYQHEDEDILRAFRRHHLYVEHTEEFGPTPAHNNRLLFKMYSGRKNASR